MRFLVALNGQVAPDSGMGGTVWQTNEALVRLGHQVRTIGAPDLPRTIRHLNLYQAIELPHRMLRAVQAALDREPCDVALISQPYGYAVGRWLRDRQPRVVYLHRSHGHELSVLCAVPRAAHAPLGPTQAPWRRALSSILGARLNAQARLALKYADGTIVPSTLDRTFLLEREGVAPERVRTIFHAAPPLFLDTPVRSYTAERHRRIVFVGTFTTMKGGDLIWALGAGLLRRFADASLTVVTPRESHPMVRAGFAEDVRARVTLVNWLPQAALMDVYDRHGVQLITSRYEGAGKVHYEGMARGLCVVSSAVGAMVDSITSGENGCLVPVGDVAAFEREASALIGDLDAAARMAARARETSCRFTWERTARAIVEYAEATRARTQV